MKKLLFVTLVTFFAINSANGQNITSHTAGDRYNDLTYEYFYGTNSDVSVDVKRVIASDIQTDPKVLEILINDNDVAVWLLAKENLKAIKSL